MIDVTLAASGLTVAFNTCVLILAMLGYMAILRLLLDFQSFKANRTRKWHWLVAWAYAMWLTIAVAIWFGLGYHGPKLLDDGLWSHVPLYAWAVLLVGVLACLTSLGVWIRKAMHEAPKASVSCVPRTLPIHPDLRKPKDDKPGLSDLLGKLPGNLIYDAQIIEEQVRLPRLPEEWEGLSVLHLSDLHLNYTPNRPFFEKVVEHAMDLKPDIIALTGDIIGNSHRIRWIPSVLKKLKAPLGKYYILGDHDYSAADPEKIHDVMAMSGWIDVGGSYIVSPIRGKNLLIMGTSRPWNKKHTPAPMGTTVQFSIALSHYPHHLEWASNRHFDLLLTGHPTGGMLNLPWPGLVGPSAKRPGLHYRMPTLMNVSHGMSRAWSTTFLQQPGITRLVLHGPNPADKPTVPLAFDHPAPDENHKADPEELQRILKEQEEQLKRTKGKAATSDPRDKLKREEINFEDDNP